MRELVIITMCLAGLARTILEFGMVNGWWPHRENKTTNAKHAVGRSVVVVDGRWAQRTIQ